MDLLASWMLLIAFAVCVAGLPSAAPVHLVEQAPISVTTVAPGVILVDFGRVALGNVRLTPLATFLQTPLCWLDFSL